MLIGEVSQRSGVSARMLRHYEKLGLVSPQLASSGYRTFSEDDLRRIFYIEGLRSLGLSLQQVHDALDDDAFDPQGIITELIAETTARIETERELLTRLKAVKNASASDWDAALDVVQILQRLRSVDPAQRQSLAFDAGSGRTSIAAETLVESALKETHLNAEGALSWAVVQQGEKAVALAARGINSKDAEVRLRAVKIMASASLTAEFMGILRGLLTDQEPRVRAEVALVLGKNNDAQAVAELLDMVKTGMRDVEAAELLAGYSEPKTSDIVQQFEYLLVQSETMSPIRGRVTQALAEFTSSSSRARELAEQLIDDDNPIVAFTATAILKASGTT
ncbi:MerR family transcriptional regulator [Corynebacterium crudilactis]|uniref:MerR family transcriptional regulator n=1 Tax=Corynebacterium crudilactis TaxID=1652495 RepID=A0A172QUM1_9CORY|nr:MerR family transcriptional regulator [Corynebacterium crudilactis]ANE04392.1 MerR family transcriptional regulator [Corynebacterium crudilactis]